MQNVYKHRAESVLLLDAGLPGVDAAEPSDSEPVRMAKVYSRFSLVFVDLSSSVMRSSAIPHETR